MIFPSTYSIVAFDSKLNAWGVAVASKFPAVGSIVPWAQAKAGAIATQAYANPSFGSKGLQMLASGFSAEETLSKLLGIDKGRETRQIGIVDSSGSSATFTGKECFEWAGGVNGKGYAIQGNILAGKQVVLAMQEAFQVHGNFPERLYSALCAGEKAGGDRRGRQSAAIYIAKAAAGYGGFTDRWIDYRVDDHPDPVSRLGEMLELHHLYFDKSPAADRIQLTGNNLEKLQKIMQSLGYYSGIASGKFDSDTKSALDIFIGNENFEERYDSNAGWIDRPVFDYIKRKFGE
jgi:uncharacterized Ntn-hydrolase superfamily protein